MAPSHYLNQCWNFVNWTLRNKLNWSFSRKSNIFIQENVLENFICEMASILSRPQCVNPWLINYIHYKMWDEITYPFPNFNGAAVEVWEYLSNFILHFTGCMIKSMLLPNFYNFRDHSVYASSQWEMVLLCNTISQWRGTYTEWSPQFVWDMLCLTWEGLISCSNHGSSCVLQSAVNSGTVTLVVKY